MADNEQPASPPADPPNPPNPIAAPPAPILICCANDPEYPMDCHLTNCINHPDYKECCRTTEHYASCPNHPDYKECCRCSKHYKSCPNHPNYKECCKNVKHAQFCPHRFAGRILECCQSHTNEHSYCCPNHPNYKECCHAIYHNDTCPDHPHFHECCHKSHYHYRECPNYGENDGRLERLECCGNFHRQHRTDCPKANGYCKLCKNAYHKKNCSFMWRYRQDFMNHRNVPHPHNPYRIEYVIEINAEGIKRTETRTMPIFEDAPMHTTPYILNTVHKDEPTLEKIQRLLDITKCGRILLSEAHVGKVLSYKICKPE